MPLGQWIGVNQILQLLSCGDRPEPNDSVSLSRGYDLSTRIEIRPINFATMMERRCDFQAAFRIPKARCSIPGRRKNEPAIRTESGAIHPIGMVELVNELSAFGIPKASRV